MVTVTVSVGQSKIGAGALDDAGELLFQLVAVPTPTELTRRHEAIVEQIVAVTEEVGVARVQMVGISYPEMMEPPARLINNPESLTGVGNPYRDEIEMLLTKALGKPVPVEILHDAAAAVLGEMSTHGTLPGCRDGVFIVWGTGVASGIVCDGSLYWHDPVVGLMTGEIGLQVIRRVDGAYEYRPSAELPEIAEGELRLDRRMRGPALARRFWQVIGQRIGTGTDRAMDGVDLIEVNKAAREGDEVAVALIESAGVEMGRALVPFVHYWLVEREMAFAETVIIGSGVAKLGDGLDGNGEGLLIGAIRRALGEGLTSLGVGGYDVEKVVLSSIGYEREFYAFG